METEKKDLKLSLLYFSDACKNAGQSGLISGGIAQEIRGTQSNETIYWLIENLMQKLEVIDIDHLKFLAEFTANKLALEIDNFANKETDHKKASILSRINFFTPANELQKITL